MITGEKAIKFREKFSFRVFSWVHHSFPPDSGQSRTRIKYNQIESKVSLVLLLKDK